MLRAPADDEDIEKGRPSRVYALSIPPPLSMHAEELAAANLKYAPRSATPHNSVEDVFLCFFMPRNTTPSSQFSAYIRWALDLFGERFSHVECLFKFYGDPREKTSWRAFTVSENKGVQMFYRKTDWYRGARWSVLRLLTDEKKRNRMFNFALTQARERRPYNHAVMCLAVPYLSCLCAPLVSCCGPLLRSCSPSYNIGGNSVYCVQLVCEMLKHAFPDDYADLQSNRVRADYLHELLLRRPPGVQRVILDIESENETAVQTALLNFSGSDMREQPRQFNQ